MKSNPCRNCSFACVHKGKHFHNRFRYECQCCEKWKRHEEYLETKRIYKVGQPIRRFDTLMKQKYVMWGNKPFHIEAIKSLQLRTVLYLLKHGSFKFAVKKEIES